MGNIRKHVYIFIKDWSKSIEHELEQKHSLLPIKYSKGGWKVVYLILNWGRYSA